MPNPTSRILLEEYAKRNPDAARYLAMYDTINACAQNPQQCAKDEATRQLAQYLSNETGVPAADILACSKDPKGCATQAAIMAVAEQTGISPEVLSLAMQCAQSGDTDQCAKAGLILVATAACAAYTSGAGTYICSKAAPILVDFAWPYIKVVINIATFGLGIDGMIDILTFGQGLDFILAPIGGAAKLLFGDAKGKFSKSQKQSVFWQLIRVTQSMVNSSIAGLWDGMIAARQTQGLPMPWVDQGAMDWVAARWQAHHARRAKLQADYDAAKKDRSIFTGPVNLAVTLQELQWFDLLAQPWPVPQPQEVTPLLAAREFFIIRFYDKMNELGFKSPAWRTSDKGKKVKLNGGHWAAWGYENVCSNCTENDVKVFTDIALKMFMDARISKIEPATLHFIDVMSADMAADAPKLRLQLAPVSLINKISIAPRTLTKQIVAVPITKPTTTIPVNVFKRSSTALLPKRPTTDISAILAARTGADPLSQAVRWAKANPEYSIPAAAALVAFVVVGLRALALSNSSFTANAGDDIRLCPYCKEGTIIGWDEYMKMPIVGCPECGAEIKQGIRGTWGGTMRHLHGDVKRCWHSSGIDTVIHRRDCRPSRPRCKWMRAFARLPKKLRNLPTLSRGAGLCDCAIYPFDHHFGYGRCQGVAIEGYDELVPVRPWAKRGDRVENAIAEAQEEMDHYRRSKDDDPVPF